MITPNSIPNPPSAVAAGGLVYPSNLVTTQYAGLGLNFGGTGSAITQLNNISVWTPISTGPIVGAGNAVGAPNYSFILGANFVSPGSLNPTTVSSFSFDTIGLTGPPTVEANGLNGQPLNIVPVPVGNPALTAPDGYQSMTWAFTRVGISSFSVIPPNSQTGAWGVSAVSFTPTTASAPEPSSLVLAGLGALGLAARWRWRRVRAVVA